MATSEIKKDDSHIAVAAKLIPAEALALFLSISGQIKATVIGDDQLQQDITLGAAVFVCLLIVPFVLYKLRGEKAITPYIISIFAFALWVFNAQYDRLPSFNAAYDSVNIALGSIALLVFTFAAPYLLPKK